MKTLAFRLQGHLYVAAQRPGMTTHPEHHLDDQDAGEQNRNRLIDLLSTVGNRFAKNDQRRTESHGHQEACDDPSPQIARPTAIDIVLGQPSAEDADDQEGFDALPPNDEGDIPEPHVICSSLGNQNRRW
jgi:hypothetical protein